MNDSIADLLTRVRNAKMAEHRYVDVLYSKTNSGILKIFQEQGFIINYLPKAEVYRIRVFLRYKRDKDRTCAIRGLRRISKPSVRKYVTCDKIPLVYGGLGVSIISTSRGIMDGRRAREEKLGGEHLCNIW